MLFIFKKKIYGYECDVYGHLNNANYLQVYEAARCEALVEMGLPLSTLKTEGIMMFIVRAELEYLKGVQLDEVITVKSRILSHNRLEANWHQEIYNPAGVLCGRGKLKLVYVKEHKPARISKELFEFFDGFYDEGDGI